ncbi:MAG: homoserine dehydrogenase [Lachnospiraceae bacterium]|nr:homoserine dehydrogenase [Lachnospiraceae bacterium]
MINVAVFGYGTVGSGTVEVIMDNNDVISKNIGDRIDVKAILDLRDFPGDKYESRIVHDVDVIVNDPEIDIICETMGGVGAAYKFTKMALEAGKSVCTSNKELVALHGPELLKIAADHNCSYKFEASVGGGIPIIRPLQDALTAEVIQSVCGIVNGTTNYMLTKMDKEGAEFEDVLKEAQANGYAEADPTADIEGHDACRKIAILSSLVFGKTIRSEEIPTEGITAISARDMKYAKQLGRKIKLLARYESKDGKRYAMVAPFLLTPENPLYFVDDVFNAIKVTGNMLGEAMFYGRGAGKLATASAVVGDVVECAKNKGKNIPCDWTDEVVTLKDKELSFRHFFVRVGAEVACEAKEAFPVEEEVKVGFYDEFAFVTKVMSEKDFEEKKSKMGAGVINYIRMED